MKMDKGKNKTRNITKWKIQVSSLNASKETDQSSKIRENFKDSWQSRKEIKKWIESTEMSKTEELQENLQTLRDKDKKSEQESKHKDRTTSHLGKVR